MRRRTAAAGDGSIYQTADRSWRGYLSIGYEGGRRRRKYVSGATQRETREALARLRDDALNGLPIRTDERETVGDFLIRWLETVKPSLRARTWVMYETHVRKHLVPHIGSVRLTALATDQVKATLNRLLASGLAPERAPYSSHTAAGTQCGH